MDIESEILEEIEDNILSLNDEIQVYRKKDKNNKWIISHWYYEDKIMKSILERLCDDLEPDVYRTLEYIYIKDKPYLDSIKVHLALNELINERK